MSGIKLTDFGTNKRVVTDFSAAMPLSTGTFDACNSMGTVGYQPPEALHLVEKNVRGRYNPAAWDVWSLGQTLVVMLGVDCCEIADVHTWTPAGVRKTQRLRLPLETYRDTQLLQHDTPPGEAPTHPKLWARNPAFQSLGKRLSAEARDLLNRMMEEDPQKRIALGQLLDHPWFTKASRDAGHGAGKKRWRVEDGDDAAMAAARQAAEAAQEEMRSRCAAGGGALPPVSDALAAARSQQGASGFLDMGFLTATASGAAPCGAVRQAPPPDDATFVSESYAVDCLSACAGAAGAYSAASAFCAVSQRLAALGLQQPRHARDHAALRLRGEGLAGGECFTAQVLAINTQRLFVHLQRVPRAAELGGAASLPRSSSAPVQLEPEEEPVAKAARTAYPRPPSPTGVDMPSLMSWRTDSAVPAAAGGAGSTATLGSDSAFTDASGAMQQVTTGVAPAPLSTASCGVAPPCTLQAPGAAWPPAAFGAAPPATQSPSAFSFGPAAGMSAVELPQSPPPPGGVGASPFGFAQQGGAAAPQAAPARPGEAFHASFASAAALAPLPLLPLPSPQMATLTLSDVAEQLRLHFELEAQHQHDEAPAEAAGLGDDAAADEDGGAGLMPS
jgi:hypothetical protein